MFRELYKTEFLIEDAAERIQELTDDDWQLETGYADHDPHAAEQLRNNGVYTAKAKKDVSEGIQKVKGRMKLDSRGEPNLYIMRGARVHAPDQSLTLDDKPLCTSEEIPGYKWKDDSENDVPVKENDHGCDAMRYLVFSIDEGNTMSADEMSQWEDLVNNAF